MQESTPLISVLICTHNPNRYVLDWVLDTLVDQTLPSSEYEIVVVDNNSTTPIEAEALKGKRPLPLRVIREPRPGKTFACCTAIREARSPLLVMVDDDNGLAADYLAEAARIARENPGIGAFGGIARLLTDQRLPVWKRRLLPYLAVRDYGPEAITSFDSRWGKWEPVGAGMVFKREVGLRFIECMETNPLAHHLTRLGRGHPIGEDTLLARVSYWIGYSCSYQPTLRLSHLIKGSRMKTRRLVRLIQSCARAWVINEWLCGRPPAGDSWPRLAVELIQRLRFRINEEGFRTGLVLWSWDWGQLQQAKAMAREHSSVAQPRSRSADNAG
jgi:glycosyltransferase involved in cell wall biosynthesis